MIRGAFAAALTPLADGGARLDEEAFAPYAAWLADGGVDGILACGTTGEGILLDEAERRRAAELFIAASRGRLDVAVQCGAQTTAETAALAAHAAEAGADIREGSGVASVDELDAEHVVVATDGYPSGLLGPLEGLIIPTRGQMIATEPLPERLFDCPHYSRHGFDYWQQREDGRLLAGGFRDTALDDEFTTSEETTPAIQASLESLVSDLVGWPVVMTWPAAFIAV